MSSLKKPSRRALLPGSTKHRSLLLGLLATTFCYADPAFVTVDPASAVTSTFGAEFNTNGSFDNWSPNGGVSGATVAGGLLTGTSTTADPWIQVSNIAGGPDLDLGFNDYLEIRMQLPATYAGNFELYFGVTDAGVAAQTGFSGGRSVVVPNSAIPKDGAFHTYRIDLGPVPMWRGYLNDLRIDPATVSGTAFAIDFIRVGDDASDVYQRNTMDFADNGAYELSSKRFRFLWNADRELNFGMNAAWARKNLRNAEETWQVYVKQYGYNEPAESIDAAKRALYPGKWKTNFLCWYDGFWMTGSGNSFGYMNLHPGGLRADPPTWVVPHELMHVFQMHQGGANVGNGPMGKWWEAHANYGREIWLQAMNRSYDSNQTAWTGISAGFLRSSNLFHSHGSHYYDNWPIFQYVDENPDNLPDLGMATGANQNAFSARLWRESIHPEYIYEALERLTPTSSLKDVIGNYASRMATADLANQADIQVSLNNQDPEHTQRKRITDLVRRADDPAWLQPYAASLPMAFTYATHELAPTGTGAGRVVSVNLRGIVNPDRQSDWRARLVVVNDSGIERYSPLWSTGSQSVTLAANENKVLLTVAATPGEIQPTYHLDSDQPYISHPARERFPYELQISGATAKGSGTGSTSLVAHANGGGLKASTATVETGAYVGPNARVLDYAVVRSGARVEDNAVVSGRALLRNGAVVRGHARVREYALLESCDVSGNARIGGHASVGGGMVVRDNATVKGVGNLWRSQGDDYIGGDAVMDGDFQNGNTATNGFHFGWEWGGLQDGTIAAKTAPSALFASYEFPASHAYAAKDQYGATDGLMVGSPTWVSTDGVRNGFITFNGSGQYVLLNRWVGDFRAATFTTRVKWAGGAANQALFHFGDGTSNNQIYVTPSNASGVCELRVVRNGTSYSVPAATALPVGSWVRLSVTFDGTAAALYINDQPVGSVACNVRPEDILPADTNETPAHCYIGRGTGLADFQGSVDDFKAYSSAIAGSVGVGVEVLTASTTEQGAPTTFRLRRLVLDSASLATPLTVGYSMSGSAANGTDYLLTSGSAVVPANASFVDVTITPVPDGTTEPLETVVLTVNPATGYRVAAGNASATVDLIDSLSLFDNQLAWYRFNETSGTIANDSANLNNDATLVNGPTWSAGSLSFDGVNDAVHTPVANGGTRTLAAWINPVSSTAKGCVFDTDVPYQYGTGWGVVNGTIEVILDNQFWGTGVAVTNNTWQHVALAFDATQARVYLNGALAATLNYARGDISAANYKIGVSNAGGANFNGRIRDARIFAIAVTDLDAAELPAGSLQGPSTAPANLAANIGNGSIGLTWDASGPAGTRYYIARATSPGGPFVFVGTTTGTSFNDTGLANGTAYSYTVYSANGSGLSPASTEVTATAQGDLLWTNSAGTGLWNATDANWSGQNWFAGGTGVIAHTSAAQSITLQGAIQANLLSIGNGTGNANYSLVGQAGASLTVNQFRIQGDLGSHLGINPTTTLNDLALTVSGDLTVGRINAVIGGNSTVTANRIGGAIGGVANADWGQLTIKDNANVTATTGIVGNSTAWGLNLNGGTLTTTGINYGPHSFNGTTNLNFNGTLVKAAADNANFVTVTGGYDFVPVIQSGGALLDTNGYNIGIGAALSGSGPLTKSGSGTLTLAAANTYTGATTVNAGTLVQQSATASTAHAIAAGAVLEISTGGTLNGPTTTFSGEGTLRKSGTGNILWPATTASFAMASGSLIDVQGGTFTGGSYGNDGWSANLSDLNVEAGAVFKTVEANVRVNRITGTGTIGTGYNGAGYQNLSIGVDNGSSTFAGTIANTDNNASWPGNLVKLGSGTITLAGTNNHTGSTTVSAGKLVVSGTASATSSVSVASGAELEVSGTLSTAGNINNDGTLVLTGAAQLSAGGTITNNGTIINAAPGFTLPSNLVNNGTIYNVPAAPSGLNATASSGQVSLTWSAVSGATSYSVKQSITSGGPYTTIATPTGTSQLVTGLTNGTTYYFVVTASNAAGESANSAQVSGTPQPALPGVPSGLTATAGDAQVALNWSAVSGASGYVVKQSAFSGGPYTTIATPTGTSHTATGLTNGMTYYFVVSATNIAGESANSAQASAIPQSLLPAPRLTTDIGNVGLAGSASFSSGTYTLQGAGAGITNTADACRFVYQTGSGDCSVTVRVQSLTNTGANAKVGVMIRESLAANARTAGVWVTPSSGIQFTRRTTAGGTTAVSSSTGRTAPYWVRLTRTGSTFRAFYSTNGSSWTQFGNNRTISMASTTYIGIATASGTTSALCTGVFNNEAVTP
ncbi:MAG: hypothetical protein RLZZ505_2102 [Verrucomicrobiota bacterium]|jgi:autotransporter-associated beta strand protein